MDIKKLMNLDEYLIWVNSYSTDRVSCTFDYMGATRFSIEALRTTISNLT